MSRPEFGPEVTTTIGELKVGDFIDTVFTQEGTRGVKFESGIASVVPTRYKRGRGRSMQIVPGTLFRTHRSSVGYGFPNHFKVKARIMKIT